MQLAADRRSYQSIASTVRVIFYGEGPDNALLYEWKPYLRFLMKDRKYDRLVRDVLGHLARHRRVPLLPTLPRMIRNWWCDPDWTPRYPAWLDRDFESRCDLHSRWQHYAQCQLDSAHPVHPRAHSTFADLRWESMFHGLDAGATGAPFEVRHPYFDRRLLSYM